jgi:hypothetical protein
MTANNAFERAVGQRGPRLARQDGRCAAAQLGRWVSQETALKWIAVALCAGSIALASGANGQSSEPYFRLEAAATRQLVEAALSIKVGDSRQAVLEKLRTPTSDDVLMRKERPETIGRSMKYYVLRWTRGGVNEFLDQYVDVFLDPQDRVKTISIRVTLEK